MKMNGLDFTKMYKKLKNIPKDNVGLESYEEMCRNSRVDKLERISINWKLNRYRKKFFQKQK